MAEYEEVLPGTWVEVGDEEVVVGEWYDYYPLGEEDDYGFEESD
jgi:hypothetical protein